MASDSNAPSTLGATPPKPTLTLRVGITGHRPKPHKFPQASFGFVKRRLGEVFAGIDSVLAAHAQNSQGVYSNEPHRVRLVSGLAEGADQLAVGVMPRRWTLEAILPFPRDSYLEDFKTSATGDGRDVTQGFLDCLDKAATVVALPEDPAIRRKGLTPEGTPDEYWRRRDAGYARFAGFLLRQIDVLVAVWDGQPEEGKGGTAEVLRAAIDAQIPVVWVNSLEDGFARMLEGIDEDGRVNAPDADCLSGPLAEAIDAIILLPVNTKGDDPSRESADGPEIAKRLQSFLAESWPRASHWLTYDLFKRWTEGKPVRFEIPPETNEGYIARWEPLGEDGPPVGDLRDRIAGVLRPRFAWADALAVDFSHRYRTAYFNSYLLAACAVAIALLGVFGHDWFQAPESQLAFKVMLAAIELAVILTIVGMVVLGRRRRWQEKWIEYRALAELLFNARFLAYLGEHGRAHRMGNLETASSAWFLWYLRVTIREIGLPNAQLDGTYQRALLNTVGKHVIADQRVWHEANASALHRMHRKLHKSADMCFILTVILLVAFLAGWMIFGGVMILFDGKEFGDLIGGAHDGGVELKSALSNVDASFAEKLGGWLLRLKDYVTYLAAFLPALGAALAGIRETGDFEKVSERSTKTAASLQELQDEVARARRSLSLDETGDILLSTAQALAEDLSAWQSVYGHKRLELPA
jgi:hypothetical protein